MCLGGGGRATSTEKKPKFSNAPPVVSGKQEGVENAKDTKKATQSLMIQRQKEEGTYIDPSQQNLATTTYLKSGGGNKTAQQKANLAKNKAKAKSLASARMKSKFSRGIQGRKSRTA